MAERSSKARSSVASGSEVSSGSMRDRVQYTVAKRHGKHLRMHVRSMQQRKSKDEQSFDDLESRSSANNHHRTLSLGTEVDDKVLAFLKQVQSNGEKEKEFPAFKLNNSTMQFLDRDMETKYQIETAKTSSLVTTLASFILIFFGLVSAYYHYANNNMMVMATYLCISAASTVFSFWFYYVFRTVSFLDKNSISVYYFSHGFMFSSIVFLLILINYYYTIDKTLAEIEFMIMAFVIALPGYYQMQIVITILGNIIPLILFLVQKANFFVIYRAMNTLILGSFVNLFMLHDLEKQRRSSFYSQEKMKHVNSQLSESKKKTRMLLSNLYPIPVMNKMIHAPNEKPVFESNECFVTILQEIITNYIGEMDVLWREIDAKFECIADVIASHQVHKICSTGLKIQCITGLFGESKIDVLELARRVIQESKKITSRHTSVRVGIGCGYAKGSMIEYSKKSFNIIGNGADEADMCVRYAPNWEICVSERVKDHLVEIVSLQDELVSFKQIANVKDEQSFIVIFTDKFDNEAFMGVENKKPNIMKENEIVGDSVPDDANAFKENEDEETDPFMKTWRENRFRALVGDFRFQNEAEENDFQESLITEGKKNAVFVLFTSTTVGAIMYGVVDLSLLSMNSVDLGFMNINVIYFRHYCLVPIMIFGCLSIYFSFGESNIKMEKYVQIFPFLIGSFRAIYVLVKTHLVFRKSEFIQSNTIEQVVYYYTEVLEIGQLFISVVWIVPFYASTQVVIWTLYAGSLFFFYAENIKIHGIFVYLWVFAIIITPMSVVLVMMGFRDYYYRKQFLSRKYLEKSINELSGEKEKMEILLKSTISQELYENITTKNESSLHSVENTFVIRIEYKLKMNSQQIKSEDTLFEYISELVKRIKKECELSGMKMLRATTDTFIIIQSDADGTSFKKKNIVEVERIIRASFHLQQTCQSVISGLFGCQVDTTVCIDKSLVAYGMMGSTRFTFDCVGSAVDNTFVMSGTSKRGRFLVTEEVADILSESKSMEATYISDIRNHMEETVKVYEIREVVDVMGMFMSYVDWMENVELADVETADIIEI